MAAELLVALFGDAGVGVEQGIETAANVENRDTGLGERREIIERLRFRKVAVEHRVFRVDAGNMFGVFNGPRVDFAGGGARAFHHGLFGKPGVHEMFIDCVPMRNDRAVGVVGNGAGDDTVGTPLARSARSTAASRFTKRAAR